jgi:hypothetical protein
VSTEEDKRGWTTEVLNVPAPREAAAHTGVQEARKEPGKGRAR